MLFPEEHTAHLKKWIVTRLENTSDADPDVLADYVLALLRHDGDINDVRRLCEEEIPDFLKEDSPVFVNDVFEALAYRSYLPGAPPPPPKHVALPAPSAAGQFPPSLYYDDDSMGAAQAYPPRFQNGSKKRGYTDWDDPMAQNGRDPGFGARAFKQPRRGARGARSDDMNMFGGGAPGMAPYPLPGQLPPQGPPGPATVGYFDPKGAMDAMFGMSLAAGHPMPELLRGQFPPKKRKKCRDWEKKGYCPRGTNCMFAHSNDPGYPPLPGPPFGGMQALPQPPPVEEYDPTNALMPDLFGGQGPFQGQPPIPDFGQQPRHRGGKHQNRQRRGERAPFSADGPVFDRTKSTIVVENIPEDNFTEDQVKDFFSQFGNVLEVSMQAYKRLAIVKFDNWNSANAAYQSPKVMFDNRFVKVFWYKDEGSKQPGSTPFAGGAPGAKKARHTNGSSTVDGHDASPKPEVDMEEFAKQQEEKQKAFEEKTKKREELERQREELEKRQKELIAKQLEEKAKLEAKLGGHNGTKSEDGESESKKPMSQSEALRAQLAALEAEARQMGLDPDAIDAPSPWPPRGGYGGRGRGSWRGSARGSHRGSYRGRADVHAAYAAYSLDNRPKKVILTGVDFTASDKDETLRQYLFGIGEFTDIQTTPTSTEITFKDRKTAEKFFNSVLLANKEIPGLDSSLDLAWAGSNGASGSVPTTPGASAPTPSSTSRHLGAAQGRNGSSTDGKREKTTTTTATSPDDRDHDHESGDEYHDDEAAAAAAGIDSSDKDVHILLERPSGDDHHHHSHNNQHQMDYEVADEEQWGY
ncbi:hypothetical protein B0I37DRAFT_77471 [Chaetomium sp. MPI-CAGE-AT-0009]|nr:hypothetical protein B0I37DRAFT_77471 [Chaetomium sp. MPI-CAGE-AT-0009]